jgi:hypothetical protein
MSEGSKSPEQQVPIVDEAPDFPSDQEKEDLEKLRKLTKRIREFWLENWRESFLFFAGTALLVLVPFVFAQASSTSSGLLGDFLGGYFGTIVSLLSVVLLFATLRANRSALQDQRRAIEREHFENRYFELIKMHRDNVSELEIQAAKGRRGASGKSVFVVIIREFREILERTRESAGLLNKRHTQLELVQIAYYFLFFGTGPNSTRMLRNSLRQFDEQLVATLERKLEDKAFRDLTMEKRNLGYTPFEGHQSRLGHYYRHLYQAVCYVARHKDRFDAYDYMKTIRAQMTTHEQALLLLNSLTPIGENWWTDRLIEDYKLVKNLPRNFFCPVKEINLSLRFPKNYFEWEEYAPDAADDRTSDAS